VTLVVGASLEKHNYCEACHQEAERECVKAYTSPPTAAVPVDIESITAAEFLNASGRASRNSSDKPAFKHILETLGRLPQTRQRLALELLPLAWQALERGEEPPFETVLFGCRSVSIEPQRLPEYTAWLEKIIRRSFDLRRRLSESPGEHGPFAMTLSMTLVALGRLNRERFTALLATLKLEGGEARLDRRWKVLADAEEDILRSGHPEEES
jgi:hypothetical protein